MNRNHKLFKQRKSASIGKKSRRFFELLKWLKEFDELKISTRENLFILLNGAS
jgi:hypothetical protein